MIPWVKRKKGLLKRDISCNWAFCQGQVERRVSEPRDVESTRAPVSASRSQATMMMQKALLALALAAGTAAAAGDCKASKAEASSPARPDSLGRPRPLHFPSLPSD